MTSIVRSTGPASAVHRAVGAAQTEQVAAMRRLSSGLRLTRAADDAAGLAVSQGLRAQIGGLRVALRNGQDAVSVLQVGEAALASTHDLLHRLRDLGVRAAASGSLNPAALDGIRREASLLLDGLDHVAATTRMHGTPLLDGALHARFQLGAGPDDGLVLTLPSATVAGLGLDALSWTGGLKDVTVVAGRADFGGQPGAPSLFTVDAADDDAVVALVAALGDPATDFTVNGTAVDLTGVGDRAGLAAALTDSGLVTATLVGGGVELRALTDGATPILVEGATGTSAPGVDAVPDAGGNAASVSVTVDLDDLAGSVTTSGGRTFDLARAATAVAAATGPAAKAAALASAAQAVFTDATVTVGDDGTFRVASNTSADETFTVRASGVQVTLEAVDAAIATVSRLRGRLGGTQNRVEHALSRQGVALENLTAAHARIVDADMGAGVVRLTSAGIRSQAALAVQAQVHACERAALALLLR